MNARSELRQGISGLNEGVLTDFFYALLNSAKRHETVEILYHDYVDFCHARDVEPGSQGTFSEIFNRLVEKIGREIVQ